MKVKAADIAKELGISKATVSLALNDKPGVSERTRQEIFECREWLSQGRPEETKVSDKNQIIKVVITNRELKVVYGAELDLWTDVLAVFDSGAKRLGYTVGVTYVNMLRDDIEGLTWECNQDIVAGVILNGTELWPEDWEQFRGIDKPMVIYDNDLEELARYCVVIDNRSGVNLAMSHLYQHKKKHILYLSHQEEIYNFRQRRKAFTEFIYEHNLGMERNRIVEMGTSIETVYRKMLNYLENNNLPEAFIMENYQVSIGVMRALREKKIHVPEDISLVGIDEVPSYTTGDCELTTIKIPHTDRARLTMAFLEREIEETEGIKSVIMTKCKLIMGNSVK